MKILNIMDITKRINSDTVIWPGDRGVEIIPKKSIKSGDSCNLTSINMGLHTGTHVDAPLHFFAEGKDIASLQLLRFIGHAKVFEIKEEGNISADILKKLSIEENDIVLFKTQNSQIREEDPFVKKFVYIDISAAKYLVEKKVRTVGIDYFSVDGFAMAGHPAHMALLSNEIAIIENLFLKDVKEGEYLLSCLPLKIEGVEGSPVRAVLIEMQQ